MAPKNLKKLFKSLKTKIMPKSIQKDSLSLTDEEKLRWRQLVEKCAKDKLIVDEEVPPLYEETENEV
jgi:hypothetical protein